ncbi:glycosyl hydrolase family 18 protein [Cohnella herbarum]|uniref:Glycoside hydrolase n=1 Tax=Cohnella herbarum TaxID=2728023 RepID=A0A7Z2VH96_9BACL|nr:glycosyl hydrolase family 18 protein [Cohnella herbarum]QJD83158.1 glycoside hydrolase [Cohnella herbarum]
MHRLLSRSGIFLLAFILCSSSFTALSRPASAAASLPFDDISINYATNAIVRLSQLHIIEGTGERKFEPHLAITRAEFVTMLGKLFALSPSTGPITEFRDLSRSAWYYGWVLTGVQIGYVQGTSPTLFAPTQAVTRQEAAVLMARALKQPNGSSTVGADDYSDRSRIDSWAASSVSRLRQLHLMEGDNQGNFRPKASITRQEAAVFLDRVLQREDWAKQIRQNPVEKIQLGWQYGQTTKQFEQQVASSNVNTLSPRWFFLGKSGVMDDYSDPSLLTWAHQHGKKVWAMVGNRSDLENTHQMLSSPTQRKAFVSKLVGAVKTYGIDGLNIDFENVDAQDRDTMTPFIKELGLALDEINVVLSVNVSPDLGTDWTEAFDYAALGKIADYIVLMGYDEHWGGGSTAGSISSVPWLRSGLKKLLAEVPARKTILALPFYTRDWYTNASGMHSDVWSLVEQNKAVLANNLFPVWNETLGQYYTSYLKNGVKHQMWLDDGRSLSRKMLVGEDSALAGYGYWYMGGESLDVWPSLRNIMKYHSYRFA